MLGNNIEDMVLIAASVCICPTQSCPTLCSLMDCNPPGSSVHGILQARTLAGFAIPHSRGSSQLRDQTAPPESPALQVDSLLQSHQGSKYLCASHQYITFDKWMEGG